MKKLYRSEDNRIWKGILGGIGEYFGIDPVIVRIVFVFLLLITGVFPFAILYIIAIFIVPNRQSRDNNIRDAEVVNE